MRSSNQCGAIGISFSNFVIPIYINDLDIEISSDSIYSDLDAMALSDFDRMSDWTNIRQM